MDLRERADWRGFRSMFLPGMPVPPKGVDGSSRHFCWQERTKHMEGWVMKIRLGIAVVVVGCVWASVASGQTIQGTGDNFGGGWASDGRSGYQGTGDNFGGGWVSDGRGGYQGTGNNFGSGWASDGRGGYQGTGNNSGRGYSSDGSGGLQGTGGNFGGGWNSEGQGTGENFGGGWR